MKTGKIFVIFIFMLTAIMLFGCTTDTGDKTSGSLQGIDYMSALGTEVKNIAVIDRLKVKEGLTLGEALEMFGKPRVSETSSDYPLVFSWAAADGELLYIVFETENREKFFDDLNSGKYILPTESRETTEVGIPFATENETKVFGNWIRNHKAVSAYTVKDGQKSILFDSKHAE